MLRDKNRAAHLLTFPRATLPPRVVHCVLPPSGSHHSSSPPDKMLLLSSPTISSVSITYNSLIFSPEPFSNLNDALHPEVDPNPFFHDPANAPLSCSLLFVEWCLWQFKPCTSCRYGWLHRSPRNLFFTWAELDCIHKGFHVKSPCVDSRIPHIHPSTRT